jgi:hypothetical protein
VSNDAPLWGPDRPDDAAAQPPDGDGRPDPRLRPPDPAGTQPKFDPASLLPSSADPLVARHTASPAAPAHDAEADAVEDRELAGAEQDPDDGDLLPERVPAGDAPAEAGDGYREAPHAPRFQFMTGALVAFGAAAVAALVVIVIGSAGGSGDPQPVDAWSAWRPSAGAGDGPTQIADHIGRQYRMGNGKQLVLATGGPMQVADLPLTVVLRDAQGDIQEVGGGGVLYRLCGLGPKCSIAEGKPSQERHLLLRREALELALYSFRYLKDVDNVVVFLPPPPGEDPSVALLIRKRELQGALARPLNATLFQRTPNTQTVARSPDTPFVHSLTTRQQFSIKGFTQGNQDAKAYLVLEPLAAP